MKLINLLSLSIEYLSEAVGRIFAPNDDHYPATGMVPFYDDPNSQAIWVD